MKTILVLFILFVSQQSVLAFPGADCNRRGHMAEKLDLTEEQSGAFKKIMAGQKNKRQELFTEQREQMKQRLETLHEDTRKQLSTVLTDKQLATFDELRNKKMEKIKERRKERHNWHQKTNASEDAGAIPEDTDI